MNNWDEDRFEVSVAIRDKDIPNGLLYRVSDAIGMPLEGITYKTDTTLVLADKSMEEPHVQVVLDMLEDHMNNTKYLEWMEMDRDLTNLARRTVYRGRYMGYNTVTDVVYIKQ